MKSTGNPREIGLIEVSGEFELSKLELPGFYCNNSNVPI